MNRRSLPNPLPSIAVFDRLGALFQQPQPLVTISEGEEEAALQRLAHEIVRFAPDLADRLIAEGKEKLRAELIHA